ncbi:hypothetical protein [Vibrio sp. CAU 1672]|uniref:hypothetical protein n=1 Tax=Vibrio sp. CAU 1672 TaxID=3032594 RepID=UPI0023DBD7EB|nr:hypothetical protein [Vibrio sp. CAU 1672]MDF2153924.1 hypothetical protein [Vibrio sp. CAU 1672]
MQQNEFRHVFLVSSSDYFSPLFLDALICKAGVNAQSLCVVVFGINGADETFTKTVDGVTYLAYQIVDKSIFINALSVTYFSLSALNSKPVRQVLELSPTMKDKAYMFITDDEVDRWLACQKKHGNLVPDPHFNLTQDDVWVLSQQCRFIALKSAFQDKLARVLGHQDFCAVDASVIFDTLPTKAAEALAISVATESSNRKPTILLGTKPSAFKFRDVKALLNAFIDRGLHTRYKFIVMWPYKQWKKRVLLELHLLYLCKVKKQILDLSIITSLPPLAYTAMIMSCTHLILQSRGGASSARQLMKWGQGKVCVAKNSHNELFFKDAQAIDLLSFVTFEELADNIDKHIDVEGNAVKINQEEQRSLTVLAALYS